MGSLLLLAVLIPMAGFHAEKTIQQATIEDTGSTNRLGVKIVVNPGGATQMHVPGEETRTMTINAAACNRLFHDLKAFSPLSELPTPHCMKSVSFGTSLYVEYNGERSPDLNCPAPPDSKLAQLQKDVNEIVQAVHWKPQPARRFESVPRK
jgi:hypothetical protein